MLQRLVHLGRGLLLQVVARAQDRFGRGRQQALPVVPQRLQGALVVRALERAEAAREQQPCRQSGGQGRQGVQALGLGVEFGAKVYVFWGGREGTETDSSKSAVEAIKRSREALNFLCEYALDMKYDLKFALEAKPNEPRGDIYNPTTGHMLAFISTLDHPEMVGVNPEVAHEHMAGINFMHGVAQAWEAGKLFHIDLNDQYPGRYDQDLRFGSRDLKAAFFLVKFLEDVKYDGSRHFDAHAYRTEDFEGVKDFARGCMRTYMILKDKAAQFNADPEIQAILEEINAEDQALRRKEIFLKDWAERLDAFLNFNERQVLTGAGTVSHKDAVAHAEGQYEQFAAQRRATLEAEGEAYAARVLEAPAADEAGVEELGQVAKRLTKKKGKGDAA